MIELIKNIEKKIEEILENLGVSEVKAKLVDCNRPELGQFQFNGVMAVASKNGFKPQELAQKLCDELQKCDEIEQANVAGVGFVNLTLSNNHLVEQVKNTQKELEKLSQPTGNKIFIKERKFWKSVFYSNDDHTHLSAPIAKVDICDDFVTNFFCKSF